MMDNIKAFFQSPFNRIYVLVTLALGGLSIYVMRNRKASRSWMKYIPWVSVIVLVLGLVFKTKIVEKYYN